MQSHNRTIGYSSCSAFLMRLIRSSMAAMLFGIMATTAAHAIQVKADNSSTAIDLQLLSTSIATDSSGNTYYADTAHSVVYKMSSAGVATQVSCCSGLSVGSFSNPRGVALDNNGDLYVVDTGNNRVVEINAASQISVIGTQLYQLSRPSGIAVDAGGDLYIADTGNNRVIEVAVGGQTALVSTASYTLSAPLSVSTDGQNTLYITDTGNNRIIAIPASGTPTVLFANQLSSPLSITPGVNGIAYIAQTSSSVGSPANGTGNGELPAVVASFGATNMNIDQGDGTQGSVATMNVTLTPLGGFNDTLYLSVLGLPPNTQMQLSHPIVTLNGTSAVTEALQIGIAQSGESSYLIRGVHPLSRYWHSQRILVLAGLAPFSLLLLIGIGATGKRFSRAARITGMVVALLLIPTALLSTSGCAGGYPAGLSGNATYTATLVARTANGTATYQLGSFGITLQ